MDKRRSAAAPGRRSLPIAPSLVSEAGDVQVPVEGPPPGARTVFLCSLAILIAGAAALAGQGLLRLIALVTQIAWHGRLSFVDSSPWDHGWGIFSVLVPVVGGLLVGAMARYGSRAIRGHGIPEAMEQVLTNQSRISPRVTLLKPISAAVSIGTGGPFGAEGPIIATGGALGSLLGQTFRCTSAERRTLLAAGAAAGMASIFGSPVAAVLLAVELLLFEYRPRSLIPVALASTTAAGIRIAFDGAAPVFPMPVIESSTGLGLAVYVAIGAVTGLMAVGVTRLVYAVEDAFERLPFHWAWWPAFGGLAVGIVGLVAPRTLGVGYENIRDLAGGRLLPGTVAALAGWKLVSWAIALGSGTSGGTLAPLLTVGGGFGALAGAAASFLVPGAEVHVGVAALVGMAAMFAGASRALLASVVFAFEATLQPMGLLPLLGGCTGAYLISGLLMRHTIMTEKIARRGVRVPSEYHSDPLELVVVDAVATPDPVTLRADSSLSEVRAWISAGSPEARHQGFPVLDAKGVLVGVVTRRDLLDPSREGTTLVAGLNTRPPTAVYGDCTVREAVTHMVRHAVGRLPVLSRQAPPRLTGILTRGDVLSAYRRHVEEADIQEPGISLSPVLRRMFPSRERTNAHAGEAPDPPPTP